MLEVVFDRRARRRQRCSCSRTTTAGRASTAVVVNGTTYPVRAGWNPLPVGLMRRRRGCGPDRAPQGADTAHRRHPRAARSRTCRRPRRCGRRCWPSARWPAPTSRARASTYLFQRTTGDDPFRREGEHGSASAALVRDRGDAEDGLERVFSPPAARTWAIDGWASVPNDVVRLRARPARRRARPLHVLVALPGAAGLPRLERLRRRSRSRGSAQWPSHGRVWLEWEPGAATISDADARRRCPACGGRRRSAWSAICRPRRRSTVGPDGIVRLPAPLRAKRFRIEILRAAFAPGHARRRAAAARGGDRRGARRGRTAGAGAPQRGRSTPAAARSTSASASRSVPRAHQRDARGPRRRAVRSASPGCAPLVAARRARRGSTRRARAAHAVPAAPALAGLLPRALRRPPGAVVSQGTATRGGRTGVRVALDAPGAPDPGRELQPRPARELRRPRPRRAVGRRRVRHRLERAGRLPRRSRSRSPRTAGERGLRRVADRRADPAGRRRGRLAPAAGGDPGNRPDEDGSRRTPAARCPPGARR